jgi:hypothetical protein
MAKDPVMACLWRKSPTPYSIPSMARGTSSTARNALNEFTAPEKELRIHGIFDVGIASIEVLPA